MFHPGAIAVIGDGKNEGAVGRALMKNLTGGGFEDEIWPVNPGYDEIFGIKTFPSISKRPGAVYLAVIATPIATVPDIVSECGRHHVAGAVIISAGGKEVGESGRPSCKCSRNRQYGNLFDGKHGVNVLLQDQYNLRYKALHFFTFV